MSREVRQRLAEKKCKVIASCVGEMLEEEMAEEISQSMEEAQDIEVPPELHEKLLKIIRDEKVKTARAKRVKRFWRVFKICACLFLILFVGGTIFSGSVTAFREKVFDLFFVEEPDHYDVTPVEIPYNPESVQIPDEWSNYFYPEYMPEGFQLIGTTELSTLKTMYFKNEKGDLIRFRQGDAEGSRLSIDNSKGSLQKLESEKGTMYWVELESDIILVWQERESLLQLDGAVSLEEIVKIAESTALQR